MYKKTIWIALAFLVLALIVDMTAPFLARRVIDDNILGIEKVWREVPGEQAKAVPFRGKWYKREDRFAPGEPLGAPARVLQVGRSYYFVEGDVAADGKRSVDGGMLTVETEDGVRRYPAIRVPTREMWAFFRPELAEMIRLCALYLGLLLFGSLFTYGQRLMLQISANRIVQKMREDVYAHTQRLPVGYYDNMPAGKIVSRITNDTEAVRELFVNVLANFFSGIITIAAVLVALFLLDVRLAMFALPMIPILAAWILLYRRVAGRINRFLRARLSDINAMINESIQGMPIIRAFRREKRTGREFDELNRSYFSYQKKLLMLNAVTSHNLANTLRNVTFLMLVLLFAGGRLGPSVTVGVLYAAIELMNRMMNPVVGIVNQLSNLETARVSAERVFELLDQPGVDVAEGDMPRYRGEVEFRDVSFAYKDGEPVLRNISFHARPGETVALVGHTGSGKSTIMNLLFRFYDIQEGAILIDGKDIREWSRQHLRRHMGIVLQDPFLFTGMIASNVSLGDPRISRERVEQALREVGAYDMFASLPGGIDEPIIEKGATLSAGQRQLISFARALAFDPAILILDEATSSVDTETETIIQRALDVLKRGRTTFVIAHRLSTIRSADQILVLDRGRIVERGTHDELMALRGKYYAMYRSQQGPAAVGA
jgi:ATP-binding cassette subfamily B protein